MKLIDRLVWTAVVASWSVACGVGGAIYATLRQEPPAQQERHVYRVEPAPVANLLSCPVTIHGVREWERVCRARARTSEVRP